MSGIGEGEEAQAGGLRYRLGIDDNRAQDHLPVHFPVRCCMHRASGFIWTGSVM